MKDERGLEILSTDELGKLKGGFSSYSARVEELQAPGSVSVGVRGNCSCSCDVSVDIQTL